ncbi:MAG TPA: hypothetical protein VHC94_20355 [Nitrobacter sp.]|nr:hypothetical protein [Nitrobacter sp.]
MAQFFGLRRKMAGDADVEPALDMGRELKKFEDGHGRHPLPEKDGAGSPRCASFWRTMYIAYLTDRFQYLLFNVP